MRVITAVEPIEEKSALPTVFLAGGITNCPDWQQYLIRLLEGVEIIALNPRRENFPIHDPNASTTPTHPRNKSLGNIMH